jgi:hypothetical protein
VAEDPRHEATNSEEEEPAADAEPGTEGEVPIGVPVTAEEFARLKEQAAKTTPADERECSDEDAAGGREEEEGNG